MSEVERADRATPGHPVTIEDIRAIAGPSTPHFALHARNRIRKLIERLPVDDPVRVEAERQIERLGRLAESSGDPRGMGPGGEPAVHDTGHATEPTG